MFTMEMVLKKLLNACKLQNCLRNNNLSVFFGTMILELVLNIYHGLIRMMARIFYFNRCIFMEMDSTHKVGLKKITNNKKLTMDLVGFIIILFSLEKLVLKNGEKLFQMK